jgi:hypothetical protein
MTKTDIKEAFDDCLDLATHDDNQLINDYGYTPEEIILVRERAVLITKFLDSQGISGGKSRLSKKKKIVKKKVIKKN